MKKEKEHGANSSKSTRRGVVESFKHLIASPHKVEQKKMNQKTVLQIQQILGLSVCLSFCLSVCLFVCLCVFLSVCLSVFYWIELNCFELNCFSDSPSSSERSTENVVTLPEQIGLSLSGCGFLGTYHFGVMICFQKHSKVCVCVCVIVVWCAHVYNHHKFLDVIIAYNAYWRLVGRLVARRLVGHFAGVVRGGIGAFLWAGGRVAFVSTRRHDARLSFGATTLEHCRQVSARRHFKGERTLVHFVDQTGGLHQSAGVDLSDTQLFAEMSDGQLLHTDLFNGIFCHSTANRRRREFHVQKFSLKLYSF